MSAYFQDALKLGPLCDWDALSLCGTCENQMINICGILPRLSQYIKRFGQGELIKFLLTTRSFLLCVNFPPSFHHRVHEKNGNLSRCINSTFLAQSIFTPSTTLMACTKIFTPSIASLLSSLCHSSAVLLFLALFTLFSSSAANSQYAEYCGHVVHESEATKLFLARENYPGQISNGYFSGGGGLFSSADESTVFSPPSFEFIVKTLYKTRSPDTVKLEGTLMLHGAMHNWTQYKRRFNWFPNTLVEEATLDLSGYWNESTGILCMVGNGFFHKAQGKQTLPLSAVLKLNYPKASNLSNSLVTGTVDTFADSPNHFDQISLLAYARRRYEFTMIPQAKSSCSSLKLEEESVDMDPASACFSLYGRMFRIDYKNDCTGSNCRTPSTSFGFTYKFLYLNPLQCSENGSTQIYIEFSNSSRYDYRMPIRPEKSLVGEGYWDPERNRFCLVACMIQKNSSVGDCNVGLSLWFPEVVTLMNRSDVVGHIWSNKDNNNEDYFEMVPIQRSLHSRSRLHGLKYTYTEIDAVLKSCERSNGSTLGGRRYPGAQSLAGMRFGIVITDDRDRRGYGDASMLAVGEKVYGVEYVDMKISAVKIAAMDSAAPVSNNTMWKVGYSLNYRFLRFDDDEEDETVIAAEGWYNVETGSLCMKGCKQPPTTENHGAVLDSDSPDCEILINIQLPPLNPEVEMHINGSITSTRKATDPLFFKTINFTSDHMYVSQATETIWRMDVEIIMALISLTFSSVCIAMQIFHVKKHPNILPSLSITMLLVLLLGCIIPLVLNIEASFTNSRQPFVRLQSGRWLKSNEVIVRMISMIALFLSLRLIQLGWSSRAAEEGKDYWVNEKSTIKVCLPLYCTGGLITLLVYSRWQALISYSGLILDGFLLPQIVLNIHRNSKDKVLTPFFYVGIMVTRALPHLYDVYRTRHYTHRMNSTYIYGSPQRGFYNMAWDIISPCQGFLLASLIYLQQRSGGRFFLPWRSSKFAGYEAVPPAELGL